MNARLLTEADLADLLQVTPTQAYEWRKRYRWPHVKIGRSVRYTEAHVQQILAEHAVAPDKTPTKSTGLAKGSAKRFAS